MKSSVGFTIFLILLASILIATVFIGIWYYEYYKTVKLNEYEEKFYHLINDKFARLSTRDDRFDIYVIALPKEHNDYYVLIVVLDPIEMRNQEGKSEPYKIIAVLYLVRGHDVVAKAYQEASNLWELGTEDFDNIINVDKLTNLFRYLDNNGKLLAIYYEKTVYVGCIAYYSTTLDEYFYYKTNGKISSGMYLKLMSLDAKDFIDNFTK